MKVIIFWVLSISVEQIFLNICNNSFAVVIRQKQKGKKICENCRLYSFFILSKELEYMMKWFFHNTIVLYVIQNLFCSVEHFI